MESLVQIVEVVVWPATIVVVVGLLRAPLSKLVPTLKRLKYKDLELEFEREASKILAEVERDLPEPERSDGVAERGSDIPMFRLVTPEPTDLVMRSWIELESAIRDLVGKSAYEKVSVRSLVDLLAKAGKVREETIRAILDLAALRNRVAHAESEVISADMAQSYASSVQRVKAVLGGIDA
ncbi:hypothetical protein MARSALSMR5_02554 [Marinobacter salarius]|jgi:hypothetical protein|uniref:DUF4145 domain-containing protein n=2 Tax=Marinobacter salarius TaxID=1420917 RepID=A0A1W6KAZ5_9GAMM|nr:hypothetical protein MARSALSMR5_02554 [Marinobacter salarius]